MSAPDPLLDYPARRAAAGARHDARRHAARGGHAGRPARPVASRPTSCAPRRETLLRQAAVARAAGREQLAENLERAAELASLPDDEVLAVYTALRPRRATAAELEVIAQHLADVAAPRCAAFVREAAAVMAERGLLRPAE